MLLTLLGMNMAIVGSHAVRTTAAHASDGQFAEARLTAIASEKLLRQARYRSCMSKYVNTMSTSSVCALTISAYRCHECISEYDMCL